MGRIEFLKQKERDIRAQLAAEQMKLRRQMQKEDARLFRIVGAALSITRQKAVTASG